MKQLSPFLRFLSRRAQEVRWMHSVVLGLLCLVGLLFLAGIAAVRSHAAVKASLPIAEYHDLEPHSRPSAPILPLAPIFAPSGAVSAPFHLSRGAPTMRSQPTGSPKSLAKPLMASWIALFTRPAMCRACAAFISQNRMCLRALVAILEVGQ